MYEQFFELERRPFPSAPTAELYFSGEPIESARLSAARCIERAEGPVLVIGGAGLGKSLLCSVLAEQFQTQFRVAMLSAARLCTRRALLQSILFELHLPYREMEEGELRLSLIDHLEPSDTCPNGLLLLVDEAQSLPLRLLDEVRMITNLVRDGKSRVRLVLAGGPLLEERFASPKLESFNQRIAARCYLHPLNKQQTGEYVRAMLAKAGRASNEALFDDSALDALFHATDGIPRLLNQLCDHALLMAYTGDRKQLDAAGVEEAWSDLQQLPAPCETAARPTGQSSVVEFGSLDDGDDVTNGSSLPELSGVDPVGQLDRIEQSLAKAAEVEWSEAPATLYEPAASSEPDDFQPQAPESEIELVFHGKHELFGQSFDDEEVVDDRGAAHASRKGPHIESLADRENSAMQRPTEYRRPELGVVTGHDEGSLGEPLQEEYRNDDGNAPPPDDRDIIVVVDDFPPETHFATMGSDSDRRFKQLFSNLRRV